MDGWKCAFRDWFQHILHIRKDKMRRTEYKMDVDGAKERSTDKRMNDVTNTQKEKKGA